MRKTAILTGAVASMSLAVTVIFSGSAHAAAQGAQGVTIQSGDSLSKIASQYNTTYSRLYDANGYISDPNVIFPGNALWVPAPDQQLPDRPLPTPQAVAAAVQSDNDAAQRGYVAPAATPVSVAPAPAPAAPAPAKPVATVTSAGGTVWDRLAMCESSGNWAANTNNGFYGGLQFTLSTWHANGGTGNPANASRETQIAVATRVQASQGWGAWPACSAKLGL